MRPLGSVTHIPRGRRDTWGRVRARARRLGAPQPPGRPRPFGTLRAVTWPRFPPPPRGCTLRRWPRVRARVRGTPRRGAPGEDSGAAVHGPTPARPLGDPDAEPGLDRRLGMPQQLTLQSPSKGCGARAYHRLSGCLEEGVRFHVGDPRRRCEPLRSGTTRQPLPWGYRR